MKLGSDTQSTNLGGMMPKSIQHIGDEKTLLVVDRSANLQPNNMYRAIVVTGCTYTEPDYRAWVADRWGATINAPLADLARAASAGGWITLEVLKAGSR